MEYAVAVLIALVLAGVVFLRFAGPRRVAVLPYSRIGPLFTSAEHSFLGVLHQAAAGRFTIMGKVRVADVLRPRKGLSKSDWRSAFNRVNAKHFDFVLCNPRTLAVDCVIELQDGTHDNPKRKARDSFLKEACTAAELPLLEIKARATYSVADVRRLIEQCLQN